MTGKLCGYLQGRDANSLGQSKESSLKAKIFRQINSGKEHPKNAKKPVAVRKKQLST